MHYFFSRRSYNAQTGKFTNNPADITRYVGIDTVAQAASKGHLLSAQDWARGVFDQSGSKDVLVYVHGFNTDQGEFLTRLIQISQKCAQNGFSGTVVGFDWPSAGDVFKYNTDRTNAKKVATPFVLDGLKVLLAHDPGARLHVLAHSMGAYLTARGLGEIGIGPGPNALPGRIGQGVFVAADLDQRWLMPGAWAALVMETRCKRFTHYHSAEDQVLDISGKIINIGTLRSGRDGLPNPAPASFHDIACADRYLSTVPQIKRTTEHSHRWLYDDPLFMSDMVATICGDGPDLPSRDPLANGDRRLKP